MSDPTSRSGAGRPFRWLLAGVAALVALVPIIIVLTLSGSGASHTATAAGTMGSAQAGAATTARRRQPALPSGTGAVVGYVTRPQAIRAAPGGRRLATLSTKTGFGSQMSVLVRKVKGDWLGVVNAAAGNNRLGWIRRSHVELTRVKWSLHAYLGRHQLVVMDNHRQVATFVVAVGKPSAPTPTGTYAVTDRLTTGEADGPYGCCILALSAKAPHAISDWDGGNRIAIHSYPITSTLGESVSHGCIHVTDAEGEYLLKHIPLGAPVVISSA